MSARVTFDRQSDCLEFMRWVERRADEQSAGQGDPQMGN